MSPFRGFGNSHHLGQIGAPRMTPVADARSALALAVGGERVKPIDDRVVAAMLVDQPVQRVAAEPPALGAPLTIAPFAPSDSHRCCYFTLQTHAKGYILSRKRGLH